MPEIKHRLNYDQALTDNSGIAAIPNICARHRPQQLKLNYETEMKGIGGYIIVRQEYMVMEVRSVNSSQLITELMEERRKNQELMSKLREFERAHSFMPSKPHLPNGYFSDLLDEDEYYD